MAVATPPGKTETEHDRDLAQRVDALEALIEEARRRARRRRRIYAALVLTALGAAAWALFGTGGSGGVSFGRSAGGEPSGASPPATGSHGWLPTGGPEGGDVLSLAVDPVEPSIVYAGGSGTVFKSTDGGASWRVVTHEPSTQVTALAIDPAHPDTVYAGTGSGVGKGVDGGRHWRMVNAGLFTRCESGVALHCSVAERHMRWGWERWIHALLVDPNSTDSIYALVDGGVFRTTNGGANWRFVRPRVGRLSILRSAALDPAHPGTIYASWTVRGYGSEANLYKTTDNGDSWQRVALGGSKPSFASLVVDADSPGTLLATDDSRPGVYRSTDGGMTWNVVALPLPSANGLHVLAGRGALYATTTGGTLFTSSDAGATWQTVATKGTPDSIVIDPNNSNKLYGAADGVVTSVDGGRTWAPVNRGLVSTSVAAIVLAPGSSKTLYAAANGVFKSIDGGRTWRGENNGLASGLGVTAFALNPKTPGTIYAATRGSGVYKTTDGGITWRPFNNGLHVPDVEELALDPADPRTIYAVASTDIAYGTGSWGRVFKTVDGGATWRPIAGLRGDVQAIAVDPHTADIVYAGTNRGGLFRSRDGGSTWRRVAVAHGRPWRFSPHAVVAITIDPRNPDNIYAAVQSGILKSTDGGSTWKANDAGLTNLDVFSLAIDPHNPQLVFAAATIRGAIAGERSVGTVLRSINGRESWQPYGHGLPAGGVAAFAIDPAGRTVYAATNGDGVDALELIR